MKAHLKTKQRLLTESAVTLTKLENGKEQGDKTIRAIVALKSTEHHMKKRMRDYGTKIQTKIEARVSLPTTAPLSKDIDDIQQQLTKFKKFWAEGKTTIKKETATQINKIQTRVEEIFNNQRSRLQTQVKAFNSTASTTLQRHNQLVETTIGEMKTEQTNHLNIIGSRKQDMDNAQQTALNEFNSRTTKFHHDTKSIAKGACEKIDIAAASIMNEVKKTVETHLQSEPIKRVISANALASFTDVCDSKAPDIVERVNATAKEVIQNDTWLKEHVQSIAACTVVYDKMNVQQLVESTVRSSKTKKIISAIAKTACIGHAAAADKAFSDTISEDTDDRVREEREQQFNDQQEQHEWEHQNYGRYRNNNEERERQFNEEQEQHEWKRQNNHRFFDAYKNFHNKSDGPTQAEQRRTKELDSAAEQKRALDISKSLGKFEVKNINDIPKTGVLSEHQAMNMYKQIQYDCDQLGFPFTILEELPLTKSCIPPNHGQSKPMIRNISRAIFHRLEINIPSTNKVLVAMTKPCLQKRDKYAHVRSLMRRTCDFMKLEPEGWGPSWTNNMTPEQYVVQLQVHCCSTNRKVTKVYSKFQQSKEMLHQAALSYN